MPNTHVVTAAALNLRSLPKVVSSSRIATLGQGQPVRKVADSAVAGWWQIETALNGITISGHVNSKYLGPINGALAAPAAVPGGAIPPAHLTRTAPVTRALAGGWPFALNEAGAPTRTAGAPATKVNALHAIIQWLRVEQSARYHAAGGKTYCNIYAYDYCWLAGAYLPRVWWKRDALRKLEHGTAVTPAYGTTVSEMNANALYEWFDDYATDFGWRRVSSLNDLQQHANQGGVAIISGRNADSSRSGHIVAVVPETPIAQAHRSGGVVTVPVQSQAGANNFQYGGIAWWTSTRFNGFSFWVHD